MAVLSISGEIGCHPEELARRAATHLGWHLTTGTDLLDEHRLRDSAASGVEPAPSRAWPWLAASALVRLAARGNLIYSVSGGQFLLPSLAGIIRIHLTASLSFRIGAVMVDQGLDRAAARNWLKDQEAGEMQRRRERFGKTAFRSHNVDLVINASDFNVDQQWNLLECALRLRGLIPGEALSAAAEAQMLFQIRLKLARFGLTPGLDLSAARPEFSHPTEEIFAKLLDFYRIPWQYEPRSFPLQWDKDGRVMEAFTPDFYLPEFDLYVELTTMKQSLVTRKNHKIKLLRAIYPHINIQVFYQKDIQDLILKYDLSRAEIES